jgi:Flp pilus assembly protein TadG
MKRPHPRRGVTTVEFAVCCPVFFAIIFFFLEAWQFQEYQQAIDQAAFEACRVGVVPGATASAVQAKANQILSAFGANTATVTLSPAVITDGTQSLTVTVSLCYGDVGWFYSYFSPTSVMTSSITLAHENARLKRASGS